MTYYVHLCILIAEDEKDIAYTYREALVNRGHSISIVNSLKLYSNKLHRSKKKHSKALSSVFDLVILDYKMPKIYKSHLFCNLQFMLLVCSLF